MTGPRGQPSRIRRKIGILLIIMILASWPRLSSASSPSITLVYPIPPLEETWEHLIYGAVTDYSQVRLEEIPFIRAVGRGSASGLYRDVPYDVSDRPSGVSFRIHAKLARCLERRILKNCVTECHIGQNGDN